MRARLEQSGPQDLMQLLAPSGAFLPCFLPPASCFLDLEIPLLQDAYVMQLVPCNHPRQGAYRHPLAACFAGTLPLVWEERVEHRDRGVPHRLVFVHQPGQRTFIEARVGDERILIEPRERRGVMAGKPERSIGKDPLGVGQVPDDFADAPLAGCITMTRARLGNRAQEGGRWADLRLQGADNVPIADPGDVGAVIRRVFLGRRSRGAVVRGSSRHFGGSGFFAGGVAGFLESDLKYSFTMSR